MQGNEQGGTAMRQAVVSVAATVSGWSRRSKQLAMLAADAVLLALAAWAAFELRLGDEQALNAAQWGLIALAPVLAVPVFVRLGLYRAVIRYLGEQALWAMAKAVALAALLWSVAAFMLQATGQAGMPRSIPLIYAVLALVLVTLSRFAARWFLRLPQALPSSSRPVLIYGAGQAGRQLAVSLRAGRELFAAGFWTMTHACRGRMSMACGFMPRPSCRSCSAAWACRR